MQSRPHPSSSEFGSKLIFAFLFALSLCPVLLAPMPAMVDYPNHLARMFILARDGSPQANPFYQVTWAWYPNLAMDLLVPPLARFVSVETATRLFHFAAQCLIVSGAVAIELAVKRRFHIAGIVAVIFLYSLPFSWGFVNFEFGLGIALWAIATGIYLQERPWPARLAAHVTFTVVVFFSHFFALGIYGVTIGICELWRAWSRSAPLKETLARLLLLGLPAIAVLALMTGSGGSIGGTGNAWFFAMKPFWLLHILNGYSLLLSGISVAALVGLLYVLRKRAELKLEGAGPWLAATFAILYLALPSKLFDTSFVDLRIPVAAALILPAFVSMLPSDRRLKRVLALVAIAVTAANVALVTYVWTSYNEEYRRLVESFRRLEKNKLVLVGHSHDAPDPPLGNLFDYPIYHAPTLAVHYATAFVPSLFTAPGKQPVTVRPAYSRLDVPYSGPAPVSILKKIAEGPMPADVPPFVRTWHRDYDYLYVVGAPVPNPIPAFLEPMDSGRRFALYRVRKQGSR
jgi:hypothetical protein